MLRTSSGEGVCAVSQGQDAYEEQLELEGQKTVTKHSDRDSGTRKPVLKHDWA